MISAEEAVDRLYQRGLYKFRDLLEDLAECNDSRIESIVNTVELFAFGRCKHYAENRSKYIELLPAGIDKLEKLTILAVLNENVGNKVPFAMLLDSTGKSDELDLERLLISMVDEEAVALKINDESQYVAVQDTRELRDVYNSQTYQLRVLREADVKSVAWARGQVEQWVAERIVPAQQELLDSRVIGL